MSRREVEPLWPHPPTPPENIEMGLVRRLVLCIGRGRRGEGCGYIGGQSGGTCPDCGGMLLSEEAIKEAEELATKWDAAENGGDYERTK